jgi:DNA polymerase III epsilon subunit-like protein
MKILIFDVETTGLLPKIINMENISEYPYIIQLSYILFDTEGNNIEDYFDNYIILKRKIKIPKEVTILTGIDKEKSLRGVTMITGLERLYEAMREADSVVAHNIEFDSRMLFIELMRHKEYIEGNMIDRRIFDMIGIIEKRNYCTMKKGIEICKIIAISQKGKEYYKWPKLIELHKKLFGEGVENLHDSLVDTIVCLRCCLKMKYNIHMENDIFKGLIEKLR